jgi:hypothetical protein
MVTSRSRHFALTVARRIFHLNGSFLCTDSMSVLSRLAVVDEKSLISLKMVLYRSKRVIDLLTALSRTGANRVHIFSGRTSSVLPCASQYCDGVQNCSDTRFAGCNVI